MCFSRDIIYFYIRRICIDFVKCYPNLVRRGGCIGSRWENQRKGENWGDLVVDGWTILGWISRKWDVGIWTGLGWPRIETGDERL